MISERERSEKIIKMKLQTAKVLWQEDRKDAAFLLLESIDDPRGDDLRERMGFTDDYEVGRTVNSGMPMIQISVTAVIVAVIFFIIGFVVSPDNGAAAVIEATPNGDQVVQTIVAPTPEPGETLSQPLLDMTATSASGQPTRNAVQTQQSELETWIQLSETAQYDHATATENAKATEAAGGQ